MKKLILGLAILCTTTITYAQPPAGDAKPGDWYGENVKTEGAVDLSEIAQKLENGSEVGDMKIRAKILEVCPKKGCWLKVEIDGKTTATVKMKDYGFFLPLAAKGKTVIIDGEAKMKTTSVAELRHYAEDAKKSKEEIDAITEPQKEVRIVAKGIVVVD